jgi:hypothetical protein
MKMSEAVCENPLACNCPLISDKPADPVSCVEGVLLVGSLVAITVWHCVLEELQTYVYIWVNL